MVMESSAAFIALTQQPRGRTFENTSEDQLREESELPQNNYSARAKPGPSAQPRTHLNEDSGMTIWDHIENSAATFDSLDEELIRKTNTELLLLEGADSFQDYAEAKQEIMAYNWRRMCQYSSPPSMECS
ncbi:hypothetical protein X797_006495 [Metarhizium robertsii]|uniref:Uncharacterized protein n=2 Tax=Metarhizium robertsii TaxID=568076 RepID=E9F2Z8_METRA|nr:uncharacterized protein MAA_06647 [Metarhizium robertsii ARSEF 23]EFY97864.1 hypothetical protein MAA_06647 [Metarhizium robertsii ARSEF 23]EXV00434.1 hypothetical protein X797_006495 [Metarhizium robertsii]